MIGVQLGVAAEDQGSSLRGGEVNIKHLDGGKLFEHRLRCEAAGQRSEPYAQRDVETVGQEGDEDVSFDPFDGLMEDPRGSLQIPPGVVSQIPPPREAGHDDC